MLPQKLRFVQGSVRAVATEADGNEVSTVPLMPLDDSRVVRLDAQAMSHPVKTCPVEGCGEPQSCGGFCNTHFEQRRRLGEQASASLVDGCGTAGHANGLGPGPWWQRTTAGELQPPGCKPPKSNRMTQTERNEAGCRDGCDRRGVADAARKRSLTAGDRPRERAVSGRGEPIAGVAVASGPRHGGIA